MSRRSVPIGTRARGFTLIELVVVMALLGLLLSLAVPRYINSLERGREHVAQNNLAQMREAIDRFYGDNARYPDQLEELVAKRYLRAVPLNPYTEGPDWTVVPPPAGAKGAVYDVRDPTAPGPDGDPLVHRRIGPARDLDDSRSAESAQPNAPAAASAAASR